MKHSATGMYIARDQRLPAVSSGWETHRLGTVDTLATRCFPLCFGYTWIHTLDTQPLLSGSLRKGDRISYFFKLLGPVHLHGKHSDRASERQSNTVFLSQFKKQYKNSTKAVMCSHPRRLKDGQGGHRCPSVLCATPH